MKLRMIAVLAVFVPLFSCQNSKSESQKDIDIQVSDNVAETVSFQSDLVNIDWSKIQALKDQLVSDLQKDTENSDRYIMKFLDDYSKAEKEYNDILFALPNYDSLNVLVYTSEDSVLAFKEEAALHGFSVAQSEGVTYFVKHSGFIKSDIMELLDPISAEFINLYCQEIDAVCCKDGAIVISEELLVNRALYWGELLEEVQSLSYRDIAESSFNRYSLLVCSGQENTPSFDQKTNTFRQALLESMNKIIEEYPKANASNLFKEYIVLLEQSDFKKTIEIEGYVNSLMQ